MARHKDTNEQSLMRRLSGKVCVIAGAAGAIGEGVAKRLKAEGGVVVGIDQKEHSIGDLSLIADLRVETEVMLAIVPRPTSCPRLASAPWMRVYPHDGLSSAMRTTRSAIASIPSQERVWSD